MFSKVAYAMAPAAGGGEAAGPLGALGSFMPIILILVVFYFLLIRPQQKQARLRREMLANIKKGDAVITSGGMFARVVDIDGDNILVDMGEFKAYVLRGTITNVLPAGQKIPVPVKKSKRRESQVIEEDE